MKISTESMVSIESKDKKEEKLSPIPLSVSEQDQKAALSALEADVKARLQQISEDGCPFDSKEPLTKELLERISVEDLGKIYRIALEKIASLKTEAKTSCNQRLYKPGYAVVRISTYKTIENWNEAIPPRSFALVARYEAGKWVWSLIVETNSKMADNSKDELKSETREGAIKKVKLAYQINEKKPKLKVVMVNKDDSNVLEMEKEVDAAQELIRLGIPVLDSACSDDYQHGDRSFKKKIYVDYADCRISDQESWSDLSGAHQAIQCLADEKTISPFSFADGLYVMWQLLNCISLLHKNNFLHRDIKKENFLLGPGLKLYLSDFGSLVQAKAEDKGKVPVDRVMGSIDEMAPEKIARFEKYSEMAIENYLTTTPGYPDKFPFEQWCKITGVADLRLRFKIAKHGKLQDSEEYREYATSYSEQHATFEEDVYSLGITLRDLFTGIRELDKDRQFIGAIVKVNALIEKLIAFEPEDRPSLDTALQEFMKIIPSFNFGNEHFKLTPQEERQRLNTRLFNELKGIKKTSSSSAAWVRLERLLQSQKDHPVTDASIQAEIYSSLPLFKAAELFELIDKIQSNQDLKENISEHLFKKILFDHRFWAIQAFGAQSPTGISSMQRRFKKPKLEKKHENQQDMPPVKKQSIPLSTLKEDLPPEDKNCSFFFSSISSRLRAPSTKALYSAIKSSDNYSELIKTCSQGGDNSFQFFYCKFCKQKDELSSKSEKQKTYVGQFGY